MDIVEEMRSFEADHAPDGWPAVRMAQISALCAYAEQLRAENAALTEAHSIAYDRVVESRRRMGLMRGSMTPGEWAFFVGIYPEAGEWFDASEDKS